MALMPAAAVPAAAAAVAAAPAAAASPGPAFAGVILRYTTALCAVYPAKGQNRRPDLGSAPPAHIGPLMTCKCRLDLTCAVSRLLAATGKLPTPCLTLSCHVCMLRNAGCRPQAAPGEVLLHRGLRGRAGAAQLRRRRPAPRRRASRRRSSNPSAYLHPYMRHAGSCHHDKQTSNFEAVGVLQWGLNQQGLRTLPDFDMAHVLAWLIRSGAIERYFKKNTIKKS